MLLNVKKILETPGESIPFACELDFTQLELFYEYPLQTPVFISGRVCNRAGMLELHCHVDYMLDTKCARCLKPLQVSRSADILRPMATHVENEEDDEILIIENDCVDLRAVVEETLIFDADLVHLCSEDCKGLCPVCGNDQNVSPCSCCVEADDGAANPFAEALRNIADTNL